MKIFQKRIIGENYLERWHIIPRNKFINVYLHHFVGDDKRTELHDHPWWFISVLLKGKLIETELREGTYKTHRIPWLQPRWHPHNHVHRLMMPSGTRSAWSIVITGPRKYLWGFYTNKVRTQIMSDYERDSIPHSDSVEIEEYEPDYETPCENCGATPTVTGRRKNVIILHTGLCGCCLWGEAVCLDPSNW